MPQAVGVFSIVPGEVTIGSGEAVQLEIQGSSGKQAEVKWAASPDYVASVNAKGLVLGRGEGRAWIKATAGDFMDSAVVEVRGSGGNAAFPNEPAGFGRIAEHDFSCRPGDGCALAGRWGESAGGHHRSNLSTVERGDTPIGGPWVARTRFPGGLGAGMGPVSFWGWSASDQEYRTIYISKWIRIAGSDYQNHPALTKMGWVGYGQSDIDNQGYFGVQTRSGNGNVQVVREVQPTFRQQNHVGRAEWGSGSMKVGQWHHWEVVLALNDVGRANGTFEWWIDGRLVLSVNDMIYRTRGNERGFFSYRWNPTWGGAGGFIRSRDDYMEIAHIYISGVPK